MSDWTPATITGVAAFAAAAGGAVAWLFKQPGQLLKDQRDTIDRLRSELKAVEFERDSLCQELAACRVERAQLREHAGRLSRGASRFIDPDALDAAFDHAPCGIAVSTSEGGGRFLWVNLAFAGALGVPRDSLRNADWRPYVHPDDYHDTRLAESAAWDEPVRGYVVRYKRDESIGGGWVRTRWHCPAYRDRVTVCVVEFLGVIPR